MNILVLEEFADSYPELLNGIAHQISYAASLDHVGRDYDVLLAQPDLAAAYLRDGGGVKWIQSTWAGVRPLAEALQGRQILMTGIKDVFGGQIAEYVFTYVLEELRRPASYRAAQRQKQWQQVLPGTAATRHMVIVGTGSIGSHLAGVAKAFGIRTTGVSRSGAALPGFDKVVPVTQLGDAVTDADYVVLVLPDTEATNKLIDADVFAAMGNQPLLFNVGRGSTIDHDALLEALRKGSVRGAVLDVFDNEPLPDDSPLWDEEGIVITPHVAAVSYPADIAKIFLSNLQKYEAGEPLDYVIDLSRGY